MTGLALSIASLEHLDVFILGWLQQFAVSALVGLNWCFEQSDFTWFPVLRFMALLGICVFTV